jgi:hypothetical protein
MHRQEIQYVRDTGVYWAVVAFMAALAGLFVYALVVQLGLGRPFGDEPMSDAGLVAISLATFAFCFGMVAFFRASYLRVAADEEGLTVEFSPITGRRRLAWKDLRGWRVDRFHPLWDFGGVGIHYTRKGTAYRAGGRDGLWLDLGKRKRFLVGVRDPEAWRALLLERGLPEAA